MPSFTYVRGPNGEIQSTEEVEEERRKQSIANCLERLQSEIDCFSRGDHRVSRMRAVLENAAEVGLQDHDLYKFLYKKMQNADAKMKRTILHKHNRIVEVDSKSFIGEMLIRVKVLDSSRSSTSDLHPKLIAFLGNIPVKVPSDLNAEWNDFLGIISGDDTSKMHKRIARIFSLLSRAEPGKNWKVDLVLTIIAEDYSADWHMHSYSARDCSEHARPIAMRIWKLLESVFIV